MCALSARSLTLMRALTDASTHKREDAKAQTLISTHACMKDSRYLPCAALINHVPPKNKCMLQQRAPPQHRRPRQKPRVGPIQQAITISCYTASLLRTSHSSMSLLCDINASQRSRQLNLCMIPAQSAFALRVCLRSNALVQSSLSSSFPQTEKPRVEPMPETISISRRSFYMHQLP